MGRFLWTVFRYRGAERPRRPSKRAFRDSCFPIPTALTTPLPLMQILPDTILYFLRLAWMYSAIVLMDLKICLPSAGLARRMP